MPQQLIIGMPAQVSMQGVPLFIMLASIAHMSCIISMVLPSPGFITHFMPLSVMEHVIRHAMGTIIGTGIDMGMADIALMDCIIGACMRAALFTAVLPSNQV